MEAHSLLQWSKEIFQTWRQARRERRLINGINRELLEMYRNIAAAYPQASARVRFSKLVMARNGCDESAAYEILRGAEESYAAWPLERELTLCDVIHYLTLREFYAVQGEEFWMGGTIGASVRDIVPSRLCRVRLKQPYLAERRKNARAVEA